MRSLRILAAVACYFVSTAVNNHEPLFWVARERARFKRVFYAFVLYGLSFSGPAVSFYIKPADGHIRGDRYWSKVLEGEPPEEEIPACGSVQGDCVGEVWRRAGEL
jgi:hypothetical protein